MFDHICMPHGSGGVRIARKFGQTKENFINDKACYMKYVFAVYPNEEYCLPNALVVFSTA